MKKVLIFICGLIICASTHGFADETEWSLSEFSQWMEGAKVVEIGKVVRLEAQGRVDWIVKDRIKLTEEKAREFTELVTKKNTYTSNQKLCEYLPGFAVTVEKENHAADILYCFGCKEFKAKGDGLSTQVNSFAANADMPPKLLNLFEKYYPSAGKADIEKVLS